MAEHDSDREERENRGDREPVGPVEPVESVGPAGSAGAPLDEEAAWAAIVAGYGKEPPDPPGAKPYRPVEDLKLPDIDADDTNEATGTNPTTGTTAPTGTGGTDGTGGTPEQQMPGEERPAEDRPKEGRPAAARPLGGSISFAPGVGPRDYAVREPSDEDFDEDDEGHFVPPEPPPLPDADVTAKFAWLGVVGGPVLLLLAVLFGWDMTWWLTTLAIGGFLGGFATLVTRMKTDDEDDDDDPGRGAVV
ncbi:hypothetical protein ACH4UM_09650 [Streptomyces sp. NPDC020801]|uniref:hypothetical protein n=1 Tax=unclassified Streptomyces TaxID=2593676 RepID=UPI0037BDA73F